MQSKKNRILGLFILTFILIPVSLFNFSQFGTAISDNDDLQVSIHNTLKSDSSEFQTKLISNGTYTFYKTPELDVGGYSHDLTQIEVVKIQYPTTNETNELSGSFSNIVGNQTINFNQINQYTVSAPKDTRIELNISYTSDYSNFAYTGDHFDLLGEMTGASGITWDGTFFWVLDDVTDEVFKYTADGTYTGVHFDVGSEDIDPQGITWDGEFFWMVGGYGEEVYQYTSAGVYTGFHFDVYIAGQFIAASGITWNGTHLWVLDHYCDWAWCYTTDGVYTGKKFWTQMLGSPDGITWDGTYFYVTEDPFDRITQYTATGAYTGVLWDVSTEDTYPQGITWDGTSLWMAGDAGEEVYQYEMDPLFSNIWVNNFNYSILGISYNETIELTLDSQQSTLDHINKNASLIYYFDSSDLAHYNYTNDLIIYQQNLTFTLNHTYSQAAYNYSFHVSYSSNSWKFPTEVNLKINDEDVIDSTYNSGYVYLDTFPISLEIEADSAVIFSLNITSSFRFSFNVDVISKTYLKKTFKLLSNHIIEIERIDLPSELNIKKIYLNNIDLGNDNPNYLFPTVQMNTNNIYELEIILIDNLYLPLNSALNDYETIYSNSFNSLTGEMNHSYAPNAYNTTYSINSGDLEMKSEFPNDFYEGNLTDSWSLDYNSSYTNSSYSNGNLSSTLNTYSNSIIPQQPDNFTLESGFSNFSGDLNLIDNNYTRFNSTEEGHYDTTYSFTDDADGSDPVGWVVTEGAGTTANVIATLGGHRKVLELNDADITTKVIVSQTFDDGGQVSGVIDFWVRVTESDERNWIYLKEGGTIKGKIQFRQDSRIIFWVDGSQDVRGYAANTWYHLTWEFNCDSDTQSLWIDEVFEAAGGSPWTSNTMTRIEFETQELDDVFYYIDAVDYNWTSGYYEGRSINPIPSEVNFTTQIQLDPSKILSNDTLDVVNLLYSYKTNIQQLTNISLYNFNSNQFTLINSSINNNGFYPCSFTLNQSYYNSTYDIIIRFELENAINYFELYLDQLKVQYNWTKTSGDIYTSIQKTLNYTFLNYFDNFSNYQKIYNVSIEFSYRFTNYTNYSYFANFSYNTTTFNLNVSGTWFNFSQSFLFNSSNVNYFNLTFNITNGLLEISNMSYDIWFKCLDFQNNTKLYQYFKLTPELETLDWYEKKHSRMILNISYIFTNTRYIVDYNNSVDFSYLVFNISVLSESGWVHSIYNYNQSKTETFSVNLYSILAANSKSQFLNFSLEIYISGNNSQVTISDLYLYNKFEITSIQLTANPRTDGNSVDFLEFYQSNRSFNYWYYENQSQLNDLYLIHKSTSTTISSFVNTSNNRYYFQHSSQTNDIFEVYSDYKPNWQISTSITENNKTTTKIKVDYSADLDISGVSLVLNFTRGDLFEGIELNQNQSQTLITLIVPNIDFTTTTQTLYITGARTQKTTNPRINYNSVEFNERYYYGELLLNSYTIDVNPNWNVIHSVVSNTGIYSKVKVNYKTDLPIENVNISINLKSDGCYNENWTLGSTQTVDYLLTIPNINFTATVQILYVEGSSSIPYTTISSYESDQNFNRITIDNEIDFAGFLTYPKYTQIFGLNINSSWTCYNVYYGNETYAVESLSNTSIKVLGSGFDPEITDSYLHFTMKPFVDVDWQYENDIITITINSTMEVENAFFLYQFDPSGVHTLELQSSNIKINDLSDQGDSKGYLTFNTPRVPKGITIIKIEVNFATPLEMLIQSIIIFSVCGIFIGVFYYLKSSESARTKIKGFLDKKVLSKLNKAREEKGVSEVVLEIKNNKIHLRKK